MKKKISLKNREIGKLKKKNEEMERRMVLIEENMKRENSTRDAFEKDLKRILN